MKKNQPKITIRRNVWDNWYGYISGKRVIEFYNTPFATQEQNANEWKKNMDREVSA